MDNNMTMPGAADAGGFAYNPEAVNTALGNKRAERLNEADVRRIIAATVLGTSGVLALKGGITSPDAGDELAGAIQVTVADGHDARIQVGVIANSDVQPEGLILKLVEMLECALGTEANLYPENVQVDIVEFMSEEQLEAKYGTKAAPSNARMQANDDGTMVIVFETIETLY